MDTNNQKIMAQFYEKGLIMSVCCFKCFECSMNDLEMQQELSECFAREIWYLTELTDRYGMSYESIGDHLDNNKIPLSFYLKKKILKEK